MQYAFRQFVVGKVGRRKAEYVRVENGLSAQARPERIANDPADTRIRAAVRVQRGRMVMRLHLEDEMKIVVELDDPRIVDEHGYALVARAFGTADILGRLPDGAGEEVVDALSLPARDVIYDPVEDLVLAVLGPGLGQRLQFDVRRVAADRAEMAPDRPHLLQIEGQHAIAAQPHHFIVGRLQQGKSLYRVVGLEGHLPPS